MNLDYNSQIVVESNDSTGVWMNEQRISITYNNAGDFSTTLSEDWTNNAWENSENETYVYDTSENLLTDVIQDWENGAWVNGVKKSFTYDSNNNCIIGEYFEWQNGFWTQQQGSLQLNYNNRQDYVEHDASVVKVEYVTVTGITDAIQILKYTLQQNYPNPFNPVTTINYSLEKEGRVKLTVYDVTGSIVATVVNENKPSGNYSVKFNATGLASGIYLYKLESGNYSMSKKFVFMK